MPTNSNMSQNYKPDGGTPYDETKVEKAEFPFDSFP